MPADRLPHPLLTAHVDLPPGDGHPLGRWGDRRGDHRANRGRKTGDICLGHDRQSSLERHRARADARDRVGTADDVSPSSVSAAVDLGIGRTDGIDLLEAQLQ